MTAPDRPGDRDQQQAVKVTDFDRTEARQALLLMDVDRPLTEDERGLVERVAWLKAAARAGEAARWEAKIGALATKWDREGGRWTYEEFARALLDGEQR